jgi:hypothetical protein
MTPVQVWHPKEQAAWVNLIATCCSSQPRGIPATLPCEAMGMAERMAHRRLERGYRVSAFE